MDQLPIFLLSCLFVAACVPCETESESTSGTTSSSSSSCSCNCPDGPPEPLVVDTFCAFPANAGKACCATADPPGVCIDHECHARGEGGGLVP